MPEDKGYGKSKRKKAPPKPGKSKKGSLIPPRPLAQQRSKKPKKSNIRRVSAPARPKRR